MTGCSARDRCSRAGEGLGRAGFGLEAVTVEVGVVDGGVEVEAVGVAAAGDGDVAPLAVERVGAEHEGVVHGQALGLVAGDGVPVGDVAGVEVAAGQR